MDPDEFFGGYAPTVADTCRRLRTLVRDVLPDAEEIVFTGWRNVSYGTGESHGDSDLICYIAPYTTTVNLGFYRGTRLDDPAGLLRGTGALLRHAKFARPDAVDDSAVLDLLREARSERWPGS